MATAWLALLAAGTDWQEPARRSLDRAAEWLVSMQRPDGGWAAPSVLAGGRSSPSVTGLCARALAGREPACGASDRAVEFLRRQVDRDGAVGAQVDPLDFPNYASASALEVFARREDCAEEARRVREYLERSQLDEDFGFGPDAPQHGGWDFGRPQPGVWFRLDLSVTAFVVCALGASGHEGWDAARRFVSRCRNETDGGYFFSPWMSKAGYDAVGDRWIPRSYGSMTADALRSLRVMGAPRDDPEVAGAMEWLRARFAPDRNPGFDGVAEDYATATQFYWLFSASEAFAAWGEGPDGWREAVAGRLAAIQREDGSFRNESDRMKESEPAIATAFAILALRRALE